MSKIKLPPNNGPYREGKGTVYEGGTRVVALTNWPGHIKPGIVDEMIHMVDLYPTLLGLAGASAARRKPLDGLDVWGTISEGKPSPRTEIVYDLQPFRAGLRQGDWKLIWRRRCRRRWSSTTSPRTRRKRTTSPPIIRTKSWAYKSAPTSSPRKWFLR